MTARVEFRVRWRREGRSSGPSVIYQSEKWAREKIDRLLALEELKPDLEQFASMPDLVGLPTLESRPVGEWEPVEVQAAGASRAAVERMSTWVDPDDDETVF